MVKPGLEVKGFGNKNTTTNNTIIHPNVFIFPSEEYYELARIISERRKYIRRAKQGLLCKYFIIKRKPGPHDVGTRHESVRLELSFRFATAVLDERGHDFTVSLEGANNQRNLGLFR